MLAAVDIGNVQITLHFDRCFRRFGIDPAAPIPPEVLKLDYGFETGALGEAAWLEGMRRWTGKNMSDSEIVDAWNEIIGGPMPGMEEQIRKFAAKGVRFVHLSDTTPPHMTKIYRTLPFGHLISGAVLSYEAGACKPEPAIFEYFERRYGVPDVFFDDLDKNVEGARKRGWNAVKFQSAAQFGNILEKLLSV